MFPFRMTDKRELEMVIMGKKSLNKKADRIIRTFTRDELVQYTIQWKKRLDLCYHKRMNTKMLS